MNLKRIVFLLIALGLFLLTFGCGDNSSSDNDPTGPNDKVALAGVTQGKGFFDINLSDPAKLPLYLDVIQQTYDGLLAQDVDPNFVIAFRGLSVTFVTQSADEATKALVAELAALPGVNFEACAVATALFGVDNASILPDIKVVGNTFISSIGYQAKGYSPILIQ